MDRLMDALFDLTPNVRYVAVYRRGELSSRQRPDLSRAGRERSHAIHQTTPWETSPRRFRAPRPS
jgi:hypothetical protein